TMVPNKHPSEKVIMNGRLTARSACMMNSYLPIKSNINAPEMPGRIIAQIARAPDRNTNHSASGLCVGELTVIRYATTMPTTMEPTTATFHRVIERRINGDEINISPKKNDQV